MIIQFFERKYLEGRPSIEKIFDVLKYEFEKNGHFVKKIKNPYELKFFFLSWLYFWKRQNGINHITGDIHWVSLVLNPKTTVLTIHDIVGVKYLTGFRRKIYYYFWLYLPIKRLNYITVISEKTKDEILSLFPWAKNKIYVVSNFLTIEPPENKVVKNNKKPHVLIVGTTINKNIQSSFNALNGLDCVVNIIGKLNENQLEYLQLNKINFNLFFDISEDKLKELYALSDILLFPSLYEGFGLPIIEAQVYNCAVITSNISPMKEVAGYGAALVDPQSVSEIREALNKIIFNEKYRNSLIKQGNQNVEKYRLDFVVKQYLDLYEVILKKN